ncbi:fructosamine kinase [Butyrivibrio sp. CB08]|uniref:fructosamine kinase family protein n=1 Tax=Butyrivibrio sp. CB08 TaxID=2364879 RepID=UPI000EA9635A|nr:fructosamine kinase family protein [Butyrivibrio sp. CB08]RKM59182.1 fructosamine kinase [Butyrivibrio sp. CB08]
MGIITEKTPVLGSLKEAVQLARGKGVTVLKHQTIHGGDANEAYRLVLSDGGSLFLKANSIENADFFRAEAEGVAAIKTTGTIRVPDIYAIGTDDGYSFLLMEFIERAGAVKEFWEQLGTGLAAMHRADTSAFVADGKYGFNSDNYIGAGKQKNAAKNSWIEFFAECRLRPQFELAAGYFDEGIIRQANRLLDNLDRFLFEPERPALLHGDLWSGNFISDENGRPMLIDPAVYVGCNEADIAMTELFGGFDRRFYEAYFDEMGQVPGYEDRRDLYNLYHLTNHLNLFGSAYLGAVIRTIERYQ